MQERRKARDSYGEAEACLELNITKCFFFNNRYAGAAGGAVGYAEAAGGTRDRGWGRRRDGFPPEASQVSGRYVVSM
jgi:hypothetical protein